MSISGLAYAGLEEAINHYLSLDPVAQQKIAALHGRVIAFELIGLGQTLYMIPSPDRLQVLSQYEGEPDCTLRGTPLALAMMSDTKRSSDQLFAGDVEMSGDTQLAHQFGKILSSIDIDWEEQLSRYTGDIIAHEMGKFVRSASHWGQRSLQTLGMDLQEYLQEEIHLLPVKPEIDLFLSGVDRARDDVERLQARIERIQRKIKQRQEQKGESE